MAITQTVPLLMLLHELDRLRRESGVSSERAAQELGCRVSKISRIFLGQSKVSAGDVKLLAELYGAEPELVDVLVDLARNLGRKGDWTSYQAVYQDSVRLLLDLELHSSTVRVVQSEIIHGLLQTEAYVRALYESPSLFGMEIDTDEVVRGRRERQNLLTSPAGRPRVSFILSESALRREYGDPTVMREQMEHLLEVAKLPSVQLQVLPFRTPSPVAFASLQFTLLHVPGPGIAAPLDFVYVEHYDDSRYVDDPETVGTFHRLWDYLQAAALGPTESAGFIGRVAEDYEQSRREGR